MSRFSFVVLAFVVLVGCSGGPAPTGGAPTGAASGGATGTGAAPAAPTPQVCVGTGHACFLQLSGKVFCAGSNIDGELGDGTGRDSFTFVPVVGVTDGKQLSCGASHTCVRRASGQISCWGSNEHGELGAGNDTATLLPVAVAGMTDAAEVAAGQGFTCARRTSGAVACWGSGEGGSLGGGNMNDSKTPVVVAGVADAGGLAAGRGHACARTATGTVLCWGGNQSGQLGRGAGQHADSATAALVADLSGATGLAAGGNNTCAIVASGELRCWGGNYQGQLGNGSAGNEAKAEVPTPVPGLAGVRAVALSENRACAIVTDGAVKCWGYNNYTAELLAVGNRAQNVQTPTHVAGVAGAVAIANGYQSTCAVTSEDALVCWGANEHGRQGIGSQLSAHEGRVSVPAIGTFTAPTSIPDMFAVTTPVSGVAPQLAMEQSRACGLTSDGKVHCFGNGTNGGLGNGAARGIPASGFAQTVLGLSDVVQVASRGSLSCAVRADGKVACWGELESGVRTSRPVSREGLEDVAELALGSGFGCARHRDGGVSCWGQNSAGQLANGTRAPSAAPVRVAGVLGATRIVAAGSTACAVLVAKTVVCWGGNTNGELGNGSTETSSLAVVPVSGLRNVTDLAADTSTLCAVAGGSVYCWGKDEHGQVGNRLRQRSGGVSTPFKEPTLRNVVRVSVGGGTVCAVDRSGEASCWGANDFAQGGFDNIDDDDVLIPTAVLRTLDPAVAAFGPYSYMGCGSTWCCGMHRDGHLSCAGSAPLGGSSGLLGTSDVRSTHPIPATGVLWAPAAPAAPAAR
jgi:alpha-tubulin suppressor-like RCC1 family protein